MVDLKNNDLIDLLNRSRDVLVTKQTADMEEELIKFLKSNGYRPKRTAKFCKYLKRKLKKQGLSLGLQIQSRIKNEGNSYNVVASYRYYFIKEETKKK